MVLQRKEILIIALCCATIVVLYDQIRFNTISSSISKIRSSSETSDKSTNDDLFQLELLRKLKELNEKLEKIDEKAKEDKIAQVKQFYQRIASREKKVFSQNNEDGIIEAIFDELKLTNANYYVEIGTQSGKTKQKAKTR